MFFIYSQYLVDTAKLLSIPYHLSFINLKFDWLECLKHISDVFN